MVSRPQDRNEKGRSLTCPICSKPAQVSSRPFCSRRCADIDLGRWLGGNYAIPTQVDDDEDGEGEWPTADGDGTA